METFSVVGMGFGLGSGNVEKKRVQVCLCFQTFPDFGQQPGFSSFCSQIIDFYHFSIFILCCFILFVSHKPHT